MWVVARGFFYLWFSIAAGLLAALATYAALGTQGPSYPLPGGGWPLVVFWPALILASFVSTQAGQFGRRVSLLKWIPLCLGATLAVAAISVLGL